MSQNATSAPNTAGATFRTNVNNAFDTLLTLNSGAAAPGTTSAGMLWYDTTNAVVKQRNATNTGWIQRWTVANAEGTLGTSLLFTPDASFDIGAAGATRPRDIFLSRTLTIGGNITQTGTGSQTFSGLVDLSAATAGQIKFPSSPNLSADAHTLDCYEEGTWTPALGGTATYTTQSGTYTRIGRSCKINGRLKPNVLGTGSTGIVGSGLPFAEASTTAGFVGYASAAAGNFTWLACYVASSTLRFVGNTAAAASVTDPFVLFQNATDVIFGAIYEV